MSHAVSNDPGKYDMSSLQGFAQQGPLAKDEYIIAATKHMRANVGLDDREEAAIVKIARAAAARQSVPLL